MENKFAHFSDEELRALRYALAAALYLKSKKHHKTLEHLREELFELSSRDDK